MLQVISRLWRTGHLARLRARDQSFGGRIAHAIKLSLHLHSHFNLLRIPKDWVTHVNELKLLKAWKARTWTPTILRYQDLKWLLLTANTAWWLQLSMTRTLFFLEIPKLVNSNRPHCAPSSSILVPFSIPGPEGGFDPNYVFILS